MSARDTYGVDVIAASWSGPLSTFFAAIAALGALGAIWQTRRLHTEDRAERAREHDERRKDLAADRQERSREREERRQDLEEDRAERQRVVEQEVRLRLLEHLDRLSDLVARVRQTARDEAHPTDQGRIGSDRAAAPFFWNARKQLELGLTIFEKLGGPELPECRNLATGSAMQFLSQVVGGATSAFEELTRTAEEIDQPKS